MNNNQALPEGFISVDEAIKLINSDTRDNAVVDVQKMMATIKFLRKNKTFRIPLIKSINKRPWIQKIGSKYIIPKNEFERTNVEHAIVSKFTEETGRAIDVESMGLKKVNTVMDDKNNGSPVIEAPTTKFGEGLNTSTVSSKE